MPYKFHPKPEVHAIDGAKPATNSQVEKHIANKETSVATNIYFLKKKFKQ